MMTVIISRFTVFRYYSLNIVYMYYVVMILQYCIVMIRDNFFFRFVLFIKILSLVTQYTNNNVTNSKS